MKKPSILLLTHLFPNSANRKLGTFLRNKAIALKRAGADVTVVAPVPMVPIPLNRIKRYRDRIVSETFAEDSGIEVHYPRYFRPPGAWFRPYEGLSMHRFSRPLLRRLHRERRFNAVIGGMLTNDGYAALLAGRDLGIPAYSFAIGADIHTFPVGKPKVRRLNERLFGELRGIFAVGPHFAEQIRETYPEFREKVRCNPFGVDVTLFQPGDLHEKEEWRKELGFRRETPVALYVGDLAPLKGVPEILQLIPRLQNLDIAFVLVGKGLLLESIQDKIENGSPGFSSCRVFPYLDIGNLVRFYQSADVFVFPSHFEGSPTVLMEAVACGLPVIASDIPPHHDAVIEGKNGWFFSVGDVDGLESFIRKFLTERGFENQVKVSREHALRHFDSLENARSLLAFISDGMGVSETEQGELPEAAND